MRTGPLFKFAMQANIADTSIRPRDMGFPYNGFEHQLLYFITSVAQVCSPFCGSSTRASHIWRGKRGTSVSRGCAQWRDRGALGITISEKEGKGVGMSEEFQTQKKGKRGAHRTVPQPLHLLSEVLGLKQAQHVSL